MLVKIEKTRDEEEQLLFLKTAPKEDSARDMVGVGFYWFRVVGKTRVR